MKMTVEHFEYMRQAILKAQSDCGKSLQDYLDAGLTAKRYRWDLSYYAKLTKWICDNLYSYLDDTHIDTALRRIVH